MTDVAQGAGSAKATSKRLSQAQSETVTSAGKYQQEIDAEQQARQAAQRATERMARLQAATAAFSRALTPEQVAQVIVQDGVWLLGTPAGAVTLFAGDAAALEAQETARRKPLWQPLPEELAAAVREPVWANSLEELRERRPYLAAALPEAVPGAVACLPLSIESRLLGVLVLCFGGARTFDAEKREFMLALAGLCAQAFDRARLYRAEQRARAQAQAMNALLEERVALRTQQLAAANASLEQENAERQQAEFRLHNLATRLQNVREAERARFAREIHEDFGQSMTGLKMDIAWLHRNLGNGDPEALRAKAASALAHIDSAIYTVRRIAAELRPGILDDLGLAAAIEWQTREFQARTGIRCKLLISAGDLRLPPARETAAFRIFQELLSNVHRHALASRMIVTLQEQDGHLLLAVRDNGRSITPAQSASPDSLGLISMRELAQAQGGRLEIAGRPGKGTTATLRVPLGQEAQ